MLGAASRAATARRCGVSPHESLQTAGLREIDLGEPAVVVLSYMNSDSLAHARFLVRRLRRRLPEAKIIVGFWDVPGGRGERPRSAARRRGADRVATIARRSDARRSLASETPAELSRRDAGPRRSRRGARALTAQAASSASSSPISPSITDSPICQKPGSLASRPKGASSSLWCLVPPAFSMAKYFSWKPLSARS